MSCIQPATANRENTDGVMAANSYIYSMYIYIIIATIKMQNLGVPISIQNLKARYVEINELLHMTIC